MSQVHTIGPEISGSRIFKFIAFLYGIASYLIFFATILYAIGFVMGLVVPKSIDTGTSTSAIEAVVVNMLLLALFAVQHSVMARPALQGLVDAISSPSRSSAAPMCCWRACACCCCSGSGARCPPSSGRSRIRTLRWRSR